MWKETSALNNMFRGINALNIDGKGRIAMPTRYRDALLSQNEGSLVITIDTEETCLLMYPVQQWQVIENNLQKLPSFNAQARRIQRLLIGHATDIEMDSQGRVLLPPLLREYANLDKHIVLIGQGNKFEVWDDAIWETKRSQWLADEAAGDGLPEEMKNFAL